MKYNNQQEKRIENGSLGFLFGDTKHSRGREIQEVMPV